MVGERGKRQAFLGQVCLLLNMYFHQKIPFLNDYKCCYFMVIIMLQGIITIPCLLIRLW
jgi:hypothetical protein